MQRDSFWKWNLPRRIGRIRCALLIHRILYDNFGSWTVIFQFGLFLRQSFNNERPNGLPCSAKIVAILEYHRVSNKCVHRACSTFRYPALRPFIIEWMMSLVRCTLHSIAQVLLSLPQQYIILFKVESVSLVCNSLDHGRIGMTVHVSAAVCISDLLWHNGHTHTAIFYRLRGTMAICLHSRRHISKWHHRKFTAMHSIAM